MFYGHHGLLNCVSVHSIVWNAATMDVSSTCNRDYNKFVVKEQIVQLSKILALLCTSAVCVSHNSAGNNIAGKTNLWIYGSKNEYRRVIFLDTFTYYIF